MTVAASWDQPGVDWDGYWDESGYEHNPDTSDYDAAAVEVALNALAKAKGKGKKGRKG